MTKFAPHMTPESVESGKLTFDERVVLHRVVLYVLPRGLRVSGLRVGSLEVWVWGWKIRVYGLGFRMQVLGFLV
jgi:hypothetical protein